MCTVQKARIEEAEREIQESQGDNIDPTASLRAALGTREHPGRVRGMGFGARPSVVYGRAGAASSAQSAAAGHASSSASVMSDPVYETRMREQLTQEITDQVYDRLETWVDSTNSVLDQIMQRVDPGGPPIRVPGLPPRPPRPTRTPGSQTDGSQPEGGQPDSTQPDA